MPTSLAKWFNVPIGRTPSGGIGARELAGHRVDGSVTSSGHDRVTVLAQGACHQSRDIVAALGHHDLYLARRFA